jgi:hypothetical protein
MANPNEVHGGTIHPVSASHDVEKSVAVDSQALPPAYTKDEDAFDSDANSNFQEGVQRARAITAIWSKWTLLTLFCL